MVEEVAYEREVMSLNRIGCKTREFMPKYGKKLDAGTVGGCFLGRVSGTLDKKASLVDWSKVVYKSVTFL